MEIHVDLDDYEDQNDPRTARVNNLIKNTANSSGNNNYNNSNNQARMSDRGVVDLDSDSTEEEKKVDYSNFLANEKYYTWVMTKFGVWKSRSDIDANVNEPEITKKVSLILERIKSNFSNTSVLLILVGIFMGLTSVAVNYGILWIQRGRMAIMTLQMLSYVVNFVIWVIFTYVALFIALFLTKFGAPAAIGSGIPEMKAVLMGITLDGFLSVKTALIKFLCLMLTVGSGIPVGKEGPFVHLSCFIADKLSRLPMFNYIQKTTQLRTHLYNSASAVGFAANLGTPIGGVLYNIETTSTYYPTRNYLISFIGSLTAAMVFRWFWNLVNGRDSLAPIVPIYYDYGNVGHSTSAIEYILAITLGLAAGCFGALFTTMNYWYCVFLRNTRLSIYRAPYLYGIIICGIAAFFSYPLLIGDYMASHPFDVLKDLFYSGPLSDTSKLANQDWARWNIFLSLIIIGAYMFILTPWAILLPVPAGVYLPTLIIGASLGRFWGEIMKIVFKPYEGWSNIIIIPGLYSIIGAASFSAGVTHTISSAIIVFEMTGDMRLLLPVLLAVLISVTTSKSFSTTSIYETNARLRNLPSLPDLKQENFDTEAKDVMDTSVKSISRKIRYDEAKRLLENNKEDFFAVIDDNDSRIFVGTVRRENITKAMVEYQESATNPNFDFSRSNLNFTLETNPFQIQASAPLSQVHLIFNAFLIQVAFITLNGKLVGVITRKDLKMIIEGLEKKNTIVERQVRKNPPPTPEANV